MRILRILLPLIALLFPLSMFAQSGATGLSFLKIGADARAMGMGDAGVATSDLGSAMYYNPALISDDEQASITIMHNEWIQDLTTEFLGLVVPFSSWTFGLHLGLTSVEGIEIRDRPGEAQGTFDSHNFAGGVTAAFAVSSGVHVGVTAKYVFEKLYTDVSDGYAFDFGVFVQPFSSQELRSLRFGGALSNLGQMSELRTVSTKLPMLLRLGVGYDVPIESMKSSFVFSAANLLLLEENTNHLNIGVEFNYVDIVFMRVGYQSNYDIKNVSFGAGTKYSSFRFDYAFTPFTESFGMAHTIALSATL